MSGVENFPEIDWTPPEIDAEEWGDESHRPLLSAGLRPSFPRKWGGSRTTLDPAFGDYWLAS